MSKYGPRYLKSEVINFKTHWAEGLEWSVEGSKGAVYNLSITTKGITCDCTGMTFRGKCKHTQQALERFEQAADPDFFEKYWQKEAISG